MERASLLRLIRLESICADTRWGLLRKISRCCFITTSGRARVIMRYLCALHYIGWAATQARCTYPSSNYRGSSGWWTVLPGRRNLAQFVTRANFVARWSARLAFVLARVLARTLARSLARRLVWRHERARKTQESLGDRIPHGILPRFLGGIGPLFAFLRSRRLRRCDMLFGQMEELIRFAMKALRLDAASI